ncbi:hypothetical protein PSTG_13340 [Puccinia striiformis f. sp. tritici PST-78]|uniref:RING-type domain-containing protein n=2 Tax=Puccinia striiformis f. sp. tritici TaxID=168172 RepID=A0A0L0V1Y4_9BASI|nr:hypothetical protein PSTG_13340 [Puccinia striiformis f. sp. tritici PST-78]
MNKWGGCGVRQASSHFYRVGASPSDMAGSGLARGVLISSGAQQTEAAPQSWRRTKMSNRWYCHACQLPFIEPVDPQDPQCQNCHSSFVEEINEQQPQAHHHFIDSFDDVDSPPIPSTRQRYEQQQQQQQQQQQLPFINLIDPLINILSAPAIPDPADRDQPNVNTQSHRSGGPLAFNNLTDFLAQHSHTFGAHQFTNRSTPSTTQDPRPRQPATTQESNNTTPPPPQQQQQQQQPVTGILSLLQSAFAFANSNSTTPETETEPRRSESNNSADRSRSSNGQQSSSSSSGPSTGDNPSSSRPAEPTRPTPRSPRVNLEESHPLRQFINILNSLNNNNPTDHTIHTNGVNSFVFNGGTTGFGFSSTVNNDTGDYVTSDSAMHDILNQLLQLSGNNLNPNGHQNPVPASDSIIQSLKKFTFDSNRLGSDEENIECAICKDTFIFEQECLELPCKHFFHDSTCIVPWLKQNGSCPVCRYSLINNQSSSSSSGTDDNVGGNQPGNRSNNDVPASSTEEEAEDAQYRPDLHDWLDPDQWYDQQEAPFDYD